MHFIKNKQWKHSIVINLQIRSVSRGLFLITSLRCPDFTETENHLMLQLEWYVWHVRERLWCPEDVVYPPYRRAAQCPWVHLCPGLKVLVSSSSCRQNCEAVNIYWGGSNKPSKTTLTFGLWNCCDIEVIL